MPSIPTTAHEANLLMGDRRSVRLGRDLYLKRSDPFGYDGRTIEVFYRRQPIVEWKADGTLLLYASRVMPVGQARVLKAVMPHGWEFLPDTNHRAGRYVLVYRGIFSAEYEGFLKFTHEGVWFWDGGGVTSQTTLESMVAENGRFRQPARRPRRLQRERQSTRDRRYQRNVDALNARIAESDPYYGSTPIRDAEYDDPVVEVGSITNAVFDIPAFVPAPQQTYTLSPAQSSLYYRLVQESAGEAVLRDFVLDPEPGDNDAR